MKWLELSVEVHPEAVDAVANVFQEHGTGGVAIEQQVATDREGEEAPTFVGLPVVKAYLPLVNPQTPEQARQIEQDLWHLQAFNLSPVGPLQRREIEEEDWAHGWKEHFHPLRIGRVVIKPSWREWEEAPEDIVIELDPGMAFGTGLHPTTRLTLAALQERVRPGTRALDLGTGSGILAMATAKLGAEVTALDVSDVAVDVAKRNVMANDLANRVVVRLGSIEEAEGTFDLVLANIIASVLIDLAPQLARALNPAGELLASGIIEERADAVREAFAASGLMVTEEEREDDWWLMVVRQA